MPDEKPRKRVSYKQSLAKIVLLLSIPVHAAQTHSQKATFITDLRHISRFTRHLSKETWRVLQEIGCEKILNCILHPAQDGARINLPKMPNACKFT